MLLRSSGLRTGHLWRGLALAILAAAALLLLHHAPPAQAQVGRTPPGDPQNVKVTSGDASLTLTWEAPSSWGSFPSEGYDVDWYAGASPPMDPSNWKKATLTASPLPSSATSYTFTGTYGDHTVANGTTYQLRVRAFSLNPNDDADPLPSSWVVVSGTPNAPTLQDLELANATSGSTAPVDLNFPFTGSYTQYASKVLKEVTSVTVTPTATDENATITVQLESDGTPETVASGAVSSAITITPKTDNSVPHTILVTVTAENGSDTRTYTIRVWQFDPVSFGGATVDDMVFTAGPEPPFDSDRDVSPVVLPKIAANLVSDYADVTYTATGLPAGLSLSSQREIVGTPDAPNSNPVTVTYTASAIGSSASLTFQVTVVSPVAFAEDAFGENNRISFEYTIGQSASINATLPEATGGHGDLTYRLVYVVSEGGSIVTKTINDDAPGFSFDAATRVLTSDTGTSAPSTAAFYSVDYWAVDENGARAYGRVNITVNDAPSLPEIEDKSLTVGVEASITLPKATGGTLREEPRLQYDLEPSRDLSPDLEGLSYNGGEHVISGTPTLPGSTELTYTVTDFNGVSASKTFTINVVNGPTAPTSAPGSVSASQESSGDDDGYTVIVGWDPLSGATAYVVQVKVDGGSYPDKPYNSLPPETFMSFASDGTRAWVNVGGLEVGDYKVRVAARNADGVGPWASEVGFTVQPGGM